MKKLQILLPALIATLIFGCSDKKSEPETGSAQVRQYPFIELSFAPGWVGDNVNISVDTNRIYFIPERYLVGQEPYRIKYGFLPDSFYHLIDSIDLQIREDRILNDTNRCFDCDVLSIVIARGKDTSRVIQWSNISESLRKFVNQIEAFSDSGRHHYKNGILMLSTQRDVTIPAPKILRDK